MAKCRYHSNCSGHRLDGFEPTLTKQAFKEECDINEILRRAENGQDISASLNARVDKYGDFSNTPDYRDALDLVQRSQSMFMELPANMRQRFDNDPALLLDFLENPANAKEAVALGLLKPPAPPPAPPPAAGGDSSIPPAPLAGGTAAASAAASVKP